MSQPTSRPRSVGSQTAIECLFMRGGTSRGPFFIAEDLPTDRAQRDAVLLAVMGSPDPRQIDGLGGATTLTSKVGIVSRNATGEADLDFLFAQLRPDSDLVDTVPNCGNMLAAVVPFALERGLVEAQEDQSTFSVRTLNTGMVAEITVATPLDAAGERVVEYAGDARIDGVPGTASPVTINFLDTAGSVCSSLLPTGHVRDRVAVAEGDIEVTCIDNGMPLVILRASDVGCTGQESPAELDANAALKARLEELRLACGVLMGLGDVTERNYPKMTLVSPPQHGGAINTRSFIPHVCHDAIGVLAAVTVATACGLAGSVAHDLAHTEPGLRQTLAIEHPAGEFTVELEIDPDNPLRTTRAALLRTARLLMRGDVLIPRGVWEPDGDGLLIGKESR
jgi:4-oxalomesaconate tautomerase